MINRRSALVFIREKVYFAFKVSQVLPAPLVVWLGPHWRCLCITEGLVHAERRGAPSDGLGTLLPNEISNRGLGLALLRFLRLKGHWNTEDHHCQGVLSFRQIIFHYLFHCLTNTVTHFWVWCLTTERINLQQKLKFTCITQDFHLECPASYIWSFKTQSSKSCSHSKIKYTQLYLSKQVLKYL